MTLSKQISEHFAQAYFGGNWTDVHLKEQLADLSVQEATAKIGDLNSIASLTYHIHFFVKATLQVLEGGELYAHDKYSFDLPPVTQQAEWETFIQKIWEEAETFSNAIARLEDDQIHQVFVDRKYGSYFRNLSGIIEHTYYHLGQIVLIKKLLRSA
ncbi:DUF1572 domain-containing protein [Zeaxanthinibacter enoshimensis]|uniref:DUF1572 domain-containing protein n=1 Tax=Zeaxanthinibacter enoshimensis TaxID=392009 RepID=UPI00356A3422